jgi:hypothetical protein
MAALNEQVERVRNLLTLEAIIRRSSKFRKIRVYLFG